MDLSARIFQSILLGALCAVVLPILSITLQVPLDRRGMNDAG
jgi:hypothetical protein